MKEISPLFEGVYDPRRSNATRYDLHEMLIIGLLSTLSGGETCSDMALYGRLKEDFLRRFLTLRHGIPSHDAFSDLFNALDTVSCPRNTHAYFWGRTRNILISCDSASKPRRI